MKEQQRRIGIYGCRRQSIRVVTIDGRRPERDRHRVPCPSCGHRHDVSPAWPQGLGGRPDVVLDAAEAA